MHSWHDCSKHIIITTGGLNEPDAFLLNAQRQFFSTNQEHGSPAGIKASCHGKLELIS